MGLYRIWIVLGDVLGLDGFSSCFYVGIFLCAYISGVTIV